MNTESEFAELHDNDAEAPRTIRMAVGERAKNSIEISLLEAMETEIDTLLPVAFIEEYAEDSDLVVLGNPEAFAHFFDGRAPTIKEVYQLRGSIETLVIEKWRPQITLARSLGGYRPHDGGPTVAEYVAAAKAAGVEPFPPGSSPP